MSTPDDPLLAESQRLLRELRERCGADALGEQAGELLIDGYAAALKLEGARRRLREQALALSQRELTLAAQEQQLRALLGTLRARIAHEGRTAGARVEAPPPPPAAQR